MIGASMNGTSKLGSVSSLGAMVMLGLCLARPAPAQIAAQLVLEMNYPKLRVTDQGHYALPGLRQHVGCPEDHDQLGEGITWPLTIC